MMKAALPHHDTIESCVTIYHEYLAMVDFLPSILAKSVRVKYSGCRLILKEKLWLFNDILSALTMIYSLALECLLHNL